MKIMLSLLALLALANPAPSPAHADLNDPMVGKKLPEITLPASTGKSVRLPADVAGHWTVLYFYPKDETPGCTRQACAYRDARKRFEKLGAAIYGVSVDDLSSHDAFKKRHELNFPLLSDHERRLGAALGVYTGESRASRDTFLVDPRGVIAEVWRKVDPAKTVEETYRAVQARVASAQ
jgi:peroxiredoxin Q/BCP